MVANVSFTPPVSSAMPASASLPPATGGDAFSKMLNQRRAEVARSEDSKPAEKPAEKSAEKTTAPAAQKTNEASAEKSADKATDKLAEKAAHKPAEKPGKKAATASTERSPQAPDAVAPTVGETPLVPGLVMGAEADDPNAPAMDPLLSDWMASLNLPSPTPPTTPVAASGDAALLASTALAGSALATPDVATDATTEASRALAGSTRVGDTPQADAAGVVPVVTSGEVLMANTANDFKNELTRASAEGSTDTSPLAAEAPLAGAAPTAQAAPLASPERLSHAAAPANVAVPTPATSPEFPQALGVQLSVLAQQGIQQAEIHLNPAEMGPIAVQIALDGSKAQIDFTAVSAATRQILENGLPELASALREAGLTLTGGGVFQQPRQSRQGDEGAREGGGRQEAGAGRIDEPAAAPRRQVRVAPGGVDLYA